MKGVRWYPYFERNSGFGVGLNLAVQREWVPLLDARGEVDLEREYGKHLKRIWTPNIFVQLGPFCAGIGVEIGAA